MTLAIGLIALAVAAWGVWRLFHPACPECQSTKIVSVAGLRG